MITDSQWNTYVEKYGKLMWKISRKISGDPMIASLEDNYADLCQTALESIEGFKKKTNKGFDEFFNTKLFDGYTKTCLWHKKASKGIKLTENMPNRAKTISIHKEMKGDKVESKYYEIEDKKSEFELSAVNVSHLFKDQSAELNQVALAIIDNPSLLREDGGVKVSTISQVTGIHINKVKQALDKMEVLMRDYGSEE